MQEFEHIQSIWQTHTVDVKISADKMLSQAKKEVGHMTTKSVFNILGMILSVLAIGSLWFFIGSGSWLTHIAMTIMTATIIIYTVILYKDYRLLANADFTAHPAEFLTKLKFYQINRFRLYNRLYWFYVISLTTGIILYFFEIASNLDLWMQIVFIAFCIIWIIFCSTIFRKAVLQKEKEKIQLLIEKFTRISNQF